MEDQAADPDDIFRPINEDLENERTSEIQRLIPKLRALDIVEISERTASNLQPRASTSMNSLCSSKSLHQQPGTPAASDICTYSLTNIAGQSSTTSGISVSFWPLKPPAASKSTYAPKPPNYPPPSTPTPPLRKFSSAATPAIVGRPMANALARLRAKKMAERPNFLKQRAPT